MEVLNASGSSAFHAIHAASAGNAGIAANYLPANASGHVDVAVVKAPDNPSVSSRTTAVITKLTSTTHQFSETHQFFEFFESKFK